MFIVLTSLIIIAIARLNSQAFRQSLFENFTKNYRNSVEFCTIFGLMNAYIFTLAYAYSPAKNASIGREYSYLLSHYLKFKLVHFFYTDNEYIDNQTFAMLNDTDEEDVVFGYKKI
jgi:hypothetical protein